jgi:hypothetical protein
LSWIVAATSSMQFNCFLVYIATVSATRSVWCRMVGNLLGGTEENFEITRGSLIPGRDLNTRPPSYEAGVLLLDH